jgi:hypothetical protein
MQKADALTFALYITGLSIRQIQSLALGVLPFHEDGSKLLGARRLFLARGGDTNLIGFGLFIDESD